MHVLCVTLFVVQCVTDTVGGAFPLFCIMYCFIEHCFILYCTYCIVLLHRVLLHIALLHIVLSVSDNGGPSRQEDYHAPCKRESHSWSKLYTDVRPVDGYCKTKMGIEF